MKTKYFSIVILFMLAFSALTPITAARAVGNACSWNGSVDANWSTPGNWDTGCSGAGGIPGAGDTLTFPLGASNTTMTDDLPAITLQSLTFSGATNYTLNGANAITLTGGVDVQAGNQNINVPLTVGGAGVNFHAASGANLALGGALNLGTNNLSATVDTASGVTGMKITGAINGSGAAKLSKYGTGDLQITGTHHLETFNLDINAGSVSADSAAPTYLPNNGKITLATGTSLNLPQFAVIGSIAGAGDIHASSSFQVRQYVTTTFTGDIFGSHQMAIIGNNSAVLTIDRSGGSLSYAGEINSNSSGKLNLVNTTATTASVFLVSQGSLELNNSHVGFIQVGHSVSGFNYDGTLIFSGTNPNIASSITVLNNSSLVSTINSLSDYGRINVTSPVNLGAGAPTFALQGSYAPAPSDVFTVIANTNGGTATLSNAAFSNLVQGGALPFNGINMVADYKAAGNTAFTLTATTPDVTPPTVQSIVRTHGNPTSFTDVAFTVTFSEPVTGVDTSDFAYFATGLTGAFVSSIQPSSPSVYWVHVYTGTGNGTLRLDVPAGATIADVAGNPLAGLPYTGGETYTVYKNGVPTDISLSASSVLENQPVGTAVGTLNTTDPDAGDTHVYSFTCAVPGTDDASFQINGNALQTNAVFDYEVKTSFSICIRTTDDKGGTFDKSFSVNILDVPGLELLAPANGAASPTLRPLFDWSDFASAKGYQIQISKSANFNTTLVNTTVNGQTNSQYATAKDLPANALLYWRVRAKLSATKYSPWSSIFTINMPNPPSVPNLIAPASNALVTSLTPALDWSDSSVPVGTTFAHYQVQIDDNADFSSLIQDTTSNSSTMVAGPLSLNTKYYWRVRAWNTNGQFSAWSAARSFREALPPPVLNSPIAGVTTGSLKPTFNWSDVSGADGYTIQVSLSNTFNSLSINVTINTPLSQYMHSVNLQSGKTYFWRVRSNGANGPSLWSVVESFTTP